MVTTGGGSFQFFISIDRVYYNELIILRFIDLNGFIDLWGEKENNKCISSDDQWIKETKAIASRILLYRSTDRVSKPSSSSTQTFFIIWERIRFASRVPRYGDTITTVAWHVSVIISDDRGTNVFTERRSRSSYSEITYFFHSSPFFSCSSPVFVVFFTAIEETIFWLLIDDVATLIDWLTLTDSPLPLSLGGSRRKSDLWQCKGERWHRTDATVEREDHVWKWKSIRRSLGLNDLWKRVKDQHWDRWKSFRCGETDDDRISPTIPSITPQWSRKRRAHFVPTQTQVIANLEVNTESRFRFACREGWSDH